jgi:hypothetical protein
VQILLYFNKEEEVNALDLDYNSYHSIGSILHMEESMRILMTIGLLLSLLAVGCGASDNATAPSFNDVEQGLEMQLPDGEWVDIDVPDNDRNAQWMAPIYQQRAWLGWFFADNYSDLFGNSLFGKEFMMCYLYNYAIFRDGNNYWFGSKELFSEDGPFNDYQIFAFVVAFEDAGEVPFYPIVEPEC